MKIAFLSTRGVRPGGWGGGTEYFLVQALAKTGHDVCVVNYPSSTEGTSRGLSQRIKPMLRTMLPASAIDRWTGPLGTGLARSLVRRLAGKKRNPAWATAKLVAFGDYFSRAIDSLAPDIVIAMDNRGIAYLDTQRPIVVWGDAVFDALLDFYPRFSNLDAQTIQEGRQAEDRQFEKARLVVYSSQWALAAAQRFHNVPAEKLAFIPYGANFELQQDDETVAAAIRDRPRDHCRLLFVCSEWHRKGGEHALRLHRRLRRTGQPCELTILGHYPKKALRTPGITCIPFIEKAAKGGPSAMLDLLRRSHFLLLPATADCTPMVIPEANSCGVPVLASDVGGIPSLIEPGVTGFHSDLGRYEENACAFVHKAFQKYHEMYLPMASRAYEHYQRHLNWDVAAQRLSEVIEARALYRAAS